MVKECFFSFLEMYGIGHESPKVDRLQLVCYIYSVGLIVLSHRINQVHWLTL